MTPGFLTQPALVMGASDPHNWRCWTLGSGWGAEGRSWEGGSGWSYLFSLKNTSMVNRLLWDPQRKEPSQNVGRLLYKNESLSTTFSLSLSLATISCGARCVVCVAKVIAFKSNGSWAQKWGSSHMVGAQRPECGHCCRETWENGTGSLGVFVLSVCFFGVGKLRRVFHGFLG